MELLTTDLHKNGAKSTVTKFAEAILEKGFCKVTIFADLVCHRFASPFLKLSILPYHRDAVLGVPTSLHGESPSQPPPEVHDGVVAARRRSPGAAAVVGHPFRRGTAA